MLNHPPLTAIERMQVQATYKAQHECPLFVSRCLKCKMVGQTLPDLRRGWCANCLKREKRQALELAEYQRLLNKLVLEWQHPWPYLEFGKAAIGNIYLQCIEDAGGNRKEALEEAHRAAGKPLPQNPQEHKPSKRRGRRSTRAT